jgi:hypothetical protein
VQFAVTALVAGLASPVVEARLTSPRFTGQFAFW